MRARAARSRRRITPEATLLQADDAAPGEALEEATDEAIDQDEPERGPLRRCVITRERGERARMLRFVVGPDRMIVPDLAATLPGRGIWLSARRDVIENARVKGAFARAARGPVTVPPDLDAMLRAGLRRRVGEIVGLARRAGQAVAGFERAREWLQLGRAGLVIEASDGSAEESRRLMGSGRGGVAAVRPLTSAELAAIFARDHVVHVAIAAGPLAERLGVEAERLAGISPAPG